MRRIFHRCVPEWDLRDLYIFTGFDLYDLQDMYDMRDLYDLQDLYDLPECNMCDLNNQYQVHLNRDAVCTVCGICMICRILYDLEDL